MPTAIKAFSMVLLVNSIIPVWHGETRHRLEDETRLPGKEGSRMGSRSVSPGPENLRRSLEETGRALEAAQAGFDQTADRDLLEYYL